MEVGMNRQQKLHIFGCIGDLVRGKRPSTPIGERMSLGQLGSMYALDQICIGDLRAEAQHRRSDLRVEKRLGNLPGMERKKVKILATRMHDFFDVWIADQVPKWGKRPLGLDGRKIDDGGNVMRGDLNQLQFGDEAIFADEFRIQAQPATGS